MEAGRVVDGTVSENSRTYSSCVPEPLYPLNSLPIAPPSSPCQPPLFSARFHASLIFGLLWTTPSFLKQEKSSFQREYAPCMWSQQSLKIWSCSVFRWGKVWVIVLLTVVQTLRCSRTFMVPTQKRKQNCVIHKILQENPVFGFSIPHIPVARIPPCLCTCPGPQPHHRLWAATQNPSKCKQTSWGWQSAWQWNPTIPQVLKKGLLNCL